MKLRTRLPKKQNEAKPHERETVFSNGIVMNFYQRSHAEQLRAKSFTSFQVEKIGSTSNPESVHNQTFLYMGQARTPKCCDSRPSHAR